MRGLVPTTIRSDEAGDDSVDEARQIKGPASLPGEVVLVQLKDRTDHETAVGNRPVTTSVVTARR
jgi:hypothetical protein